MKTHAVKLLIGLLVAGALAVGCGRQTRGSGDAHDRSRAATPAEGGATSRQGSAGQPQNFGDRDAKEAKDEASPSGGSVDKRSTSGPGSMERKDVTIQPGGTQK